MTKVLNMPYSIHPSNNKMYKDLCQNFWCNNIKKKVADYSSLLLNLLKGYVWTLLLYWGIAITPCSHIEIRFHLHGFCEGVANNYKEDGCYIGHH